MASTGNEFVTVEEMRPASLRSYLAALRKHWLASVTGATVTYFPLALTKLGWDLNLLGWGFVLVGTIVPAGYLAWRDERDRLKRLFAASPHIGTAEVRWLESGEYRFGILVIKNDGAAAHFQAKYTLEGPLWEAGALLEGLSVNDVFVAEWKSHTLAGDYNNQLECRSEYELFKGVEGILHLVTIQVNRMNTDEEHVRLIAVKPSAIGSKIQPIAFTSNRGRDAEMPYCEMALRVYARPALPGEEPWSRRFRIDATGIHEVGV